MQSPNSVKIDDLALNAEDLYMALLSSRVYQTDKNVPYDIWSICGYYKRNRFA